MRFLCLTLTLVLILLNQSCAKPHPYNQVRLLRHQYALEVEMAISNEGKATCVVTAQNNSGKKELHEITAIVRVMDASEKVLWSKQVEIPVSGVGNMAKGTLELNEQLPVSKDQIDSYDVILAPDGEQDPFQSYREYQRVVPHETK